MKKFKTLTFLAMAIVMTSVATGCAGKNKEKNTDSTEVSVSNQEAILQDSLKKAKKDSIRDARIRESNYLPDDSIRSKYDFAYFNSDGNIIISQFAEDPYERIIFPKKWGLIDRNGKEIADGRTTEVIPADYEKHNFGYYSFQTPRGYTHFYTDGKGHGIFDKNYKVIVKPIYERLELYEDLAVVRLKGKKERQVLDIASNKLLFTLDDSLQVTNATEGMLLVHNPQYEYYFIDTKGKIAIPAEKLKKYDTIYGFSEGLATVLTSDNHLGYIDKTGKEVIPTKYNYFVDDYWDTGFKDGLAIAQKEGQYGIIDKNGKAITPFKYKEIHRDNRGGFVGYMYKSYKDKPKRIGIDRKGHEYTQNYRPADPLDDWVQTSDLTQGLHGYKDFSGKEVLPTKYYQGSRFNRGMAIVGIGRTLNLIDSKGRIILKDLGRRSAFMLPG